MQKNKMEFKAFAAMPLKKKAEHIWLYYRWHLLVAAAVIAVLISGLRLVFYNTQDQLISGIFINTGTTAEGYTHLREDYITFCGQNRSRVELVEARGIHFEDDPLSQEDAANFMVLAGKIAVESLDYIITDLPSLTFFEEQEVIRDLREVLSEEALASLTPILSADGTPIAIPLAGTSFADHYELTAESCLLIVKNAPDVQKITRFLQYLLEM